MYFQTIESILKPEQPIQHSLPYLHFQTIESILKHLCKSCYSDKLTDFQTIESILKRFNGIFVESNPFKISRLLSLF